MVKHMVTYINMGADVDGPRERLEGYMDNTQQKRRYMYTQI